jgi:hypothetical protein
MKGDSNLFRDRKLHYDIKVPNQDMLDSKISKIIVPGRNFNLDEVRLAKFSSELIDTLTLSLRVERLLGINSLVYFDETVSYDKNEKTRFKNLVLKRSGYLENEDNYIAISEDLMSANSKATTLRNSRVTLLWRGFDLNDVNVKRIISLGLTFLLEGITKAELIFEIKKLIPKGIFEVSVKNRLNTYVLISVEAPVFSP